MYSDKKFFGVMIVVAGLMASFAMAVMVLPGAPARAQSVACGSEYVIKPGDTLSKLARTIYGNGDAWYIIYNANRDTIGRDASHVTPGEALVIPCLDLKAKGPSLEKIAAGIVNEIRVLCARELATYCNDVTPGEGRILACFAAHEDKLSTSCEFAIYDAASTLEKTAVRVDFLANQCASDIAQYCKNVELGEGRLLKCLKLYKSKITPYCRVAMSEFDD